MFSISLGSTKDFPFSCFCMFPLPILLPSLRLFLMSKVPVLASSDWSGFLPRDFFLPRLFFSTIHSVQSSHPFFILPLFSVFLG
jgi:hypothetical protein